MGKVFITVLLWLVVTVLVGWLFSTMVGVIVAIGWGAAVAAKWYAVPWVLRVVLGALGSEVIFPVWLVALVLSLFLALPLFAH